MQAVVKTLHIEINVKGNIPEKLLSLLKEEYGEKVKLSEDNEEEKVNIFGSMLFCVGKLFGISFNQIVGYEINTPKALHSASQGTRQSRVPWDAIAQSDGIDTSWASLGSSLTGHYPTFVGQLFEGSSANRHSAPFRNVIQFWSQQRVRKATRGPAAKSGVLNSLRNK